jgi:putative N6-adenine-specific DNA methylase
VGNWRAVWRANLRLRSANRVLVRLATWPAADGAALAAGAGALVSRSGLHWAGVTASDLFDPRNTLAIRASASRSQITDVRWAALRVKDGLVDAQRERFGQRSSIDRERPDLPLRLHLDQDLATLLLDTSGQPLDHRGYRVTTSQAPLREQLAAACVLAAEWDGQGPVVDPMCGSGTLLIEAAWFALGRDPSSLRDHWAFERFAGFNAAAFARVRNEKQPVRGADVRLYGIDRDPTAIASACNNLECAGLADRAKVMRGDAFTWTPPQEPGLVITNPAYGKRLDAAIDDMRRLGDLLKQRYTGWRAVVIAGDPGRGKHIGLRPARKISVKNGPVDARILVFDLH